jgi:hypothetical protein
VLVGIDLLAKGWSCLMVARAARLTSNLVEARIDSPD